MSTLGLVGLQVIKGFLSSNLTAQYPLVVHREVRRYQLVLAQFQKPLFQKPPDGALEGQLLSEVVEQHATQESELRPALTLIPA